MEDPVLGRYRKHWKDKFTQGCLDMAAMQRTEGSECKTCQEERDKRHRVLASHEELPARLRQDPFCSAPALYTFNIPRFFATYLRAREYAKQKKVQLTWCYARDVPMHPGEEHVAYTEREMCIGRLLRCYATHVLQNVLSRACFTLFLKNSSMFTCGSYVYGSCLYRHGCLYKAL